MAWKPSPPPPGLPTAPRSSARWYQPRCPWLCRADGTQHPLPMVGVSSPWGIQPRESSTFQWCVRGRVPGEGAKAAHHHPASVLDTRSEDLSKAVSPGRMRTSLTILCPIANPGEALNNPTPDKTSAWPMQPVCLGRPPCWGVRALELPWAVHRAGTSASPGEGMCAAGRGRAGSRAWVPSRGTISLEASRSSSLGFLGSPLSPWSSD